MQLLGGECLDEAARKDVDADLRRSIFRMVSSGMLHRVALVRTDVLEVPSASFINVTRIGEMGTTLAATNNRHTLRRNTT
jgi:hypothetical protein